MSVCGKLCPTNLLHTNFNPKTYWARFTIVFFSLPVHYDVLVQSFTIALCKYQIMKTDVLNITNVNIHAITMFIYPISRGRLASKRFPPGPKKI